MTMPQPTTPGGRPVPGEPVAGRTARARAGVAVASVLTLALVTVAGSASSDPRHATAPEAATAQAGAVTGPEDPATAERAAELPVVDPAEPTATTVADPVGTAGPAGTGGPLPIDPRAATAAGDTEQTPAVAAAQAGAQVAVAAGTTTTGGPGVPVAVCAADGSTATPGAGPAGPGSGSDGVTSPTVPASAPGGVAMPAGNLPGWTQVFADDFTTPAPLGTFTSSVYGQRWFPYGPYKDTSGRGTYDASKTVSVANGVLDINVHTENGTHYVAALVPHQPQAWGQTYGRYSFRFRADTLPGYKMVAILWPDSDNWGEGEIDFPEVTHLVTNEKMYANVYQKGNTVTYQPGPASRLTSAAPANASGWHTATIEWLPGSVAVWLDDAPLGTFTQGIPDTSFHLVFQIETNLVDAPPADSVAGHIQLDWVTFYQRS
jgi:hypothetical protein